MRDAPARSTRLPEWFRVRVGPSRDVSFVAGVVGDLGLHTVCTGAHCPNLQGCFSRGTATFMILGDVCTRECGFCAVAAGVPAVPDPGEPGRVAEAIRRLGLRMAVITSVTRDDLPDGGAGHFAETILAVRALCPEVLVEVLVPDFQGSAGALGKVLDAGPAVLNHNIETVQRLYPRVRPQADYRRSLGLLAVAHARRPRSAATKSGIMVGMGETREELLVAFRDLAQAGCDMLTVGQYLAPSSVHVRVDRFVPPDEFAVLADLARAAGIPRVASGPLVRSSYMAEELFRQSPGS